LVVLRAHSVRGESHIHRNANGEVATVNTVDPRLYLGGIKLHFAAWHQFKRVMTQAEPSGIKEVLILASRTLSPIFFSGADRGEKVVA